MLSGLQRGAIGLECECDEGRRVPRGAWWEGELRTFRTCTNGAVESCLLVART